MAYNIESKKGHIVLLLVASWLISLIFTGLFVSYTFCALALLFIVSVRMLKEMGKVIPIREIIVLIAILQCLLAPAVAYEIDAFSSIDMAVDASTYFSFVLPAMLAYIAGLYWRKKAFAPKIGYNPLYNKKGWILVGIGFVAGFVNLGFLSHLLSALKFVGVFYLIFSDSKYKYAGLCILLLSLVYQSLTQVMFHELLTWSLFIFFIFNLKRKMKLTTVFLSFLLGIGLFTGIQTIKPLLRAQLWVTEIHQSQNEIILQTISQAKIENQTMLNHVIRLNEGWHISKVLAHIPHQADYGNGESYIRSIQSAIMPRIISSNKAKAGGRENMIRYAGYEPRASMDIGLVGEAYGNFGYGGIIAMLVIGFLFGQTINFIEKKAQLSPELLLWIPFIFFQVIKAETSSITVFNHLAKASLLVWFLFSQYVHYVPFVRFFGVKKYE